MQTKKIFAANWKMNKKPEESILFCKELIAKTTDYFFNEKEIYIFPQNFSLYSIAKELIGTSIKYGPQQIHIENSGAFTGENSLALAQGFKCQICLIGHSERRQLFHESDEWISKKVNLCLEQNIKPIICIGETLEQRQSGKTFDVLHHQLWSALKSVNANQEFIVAYEPVWAIGTGQVATKDQVAEVHSYLAQQLKQKEYQLFSLLYGGSVKAENAKELIQIEYVDGFLIGGASLEVSSFLNICNCLN